MRHSSPAAAALPSDGLHKAIKERVRRAQSDGRWAKGAHLMLQAVSVASRSLTQVEEHMAATEPLPRASAFFAKTLAFVSGTR